MTPNKHQQQIEEQMLAPQYLKILQDCARLVNTTNNPDVYFPRYDLLIEKAVALASMKTVSFQGDSPRQILEHVFEQKDKNCANFIDRYFGIVKSKVYDLEREQSKHAQVEKFHDSLLKYYDKMSEENVRECENKYFFLLDEINKDYHRNYFDTAIDTTERYPVVSESYSHKESIDNDTILCLHCGTENPYGSNFCQQCASNLNDFSNNPQSHYDKPKKKNIIKIVLCTLALVIIIPLAMMSLLLFIVGSVEKITSIAVCGFVFLSLFILCSVFLIKGIRSAKGSKSTLQYNNSANTVLPPVNKLKYNYDNQSQYDGSIYDVGSNNCNNPYYEKSSTIVSIFTDKWRDICKKDFVVLDFETTGLSCVDDRIIEIAAIRYVNGIETNKFVSLVNPLMSIPAEATQVNNITNHMVADAPPERYLIPKLIDFLGDSLIVGHNANFDVKFLEIAAQRYGYNVSYNYIDTISVSKKIFPGLPNYKLSTIAENLGRDINGMHRAEEDVRVCAEIIQIALDSME